MVANVAGQLGDLAESAMKRGANVKDSGVIDAIITRAGHFIPTMQGLLAQRSVPFEALAKD